MEFPVNQAWMVYQVCAALIYYTYLLLIGFRIEKWVNRRRKKGEKNDAIMYDIAGTICSDWILKSRDVLQVGGSKLNKRTIRFRTLIAEKLLKSIKFILKINIDLEHMRLCACTLHRMTVKHKCCCVAPNFIIRANFNCNKSTDNPIELNECID